MKSKVMHLWMLWVCLNMAAEVSAMPNTPGQGNDPGTPGSSGTTSGSSTLSLGKVFGHCDKLNERNYEVWLAGLISAITGLIYLTTLYEKLEETLRYLKTSAHLTLKEIELHVGTDILQLTQNAGDRTKGAFQEFNSQLYHVFNLTIHENLVSVKQKLAGNSYFEDGLKAAVYFYEELGAGDSTSRTVTKLDLLKMNQGPEETAGEFGDRMTLKNNELVKPLDDDTLVTIFAQACTMAEVKTFLVGKMQEKDYTLDGIIKVAKTYEKTLGVAFGNEIDGLQAHLGRGPGKGKGFGNGRARGNGRGRGDGNNGDRRTNGCLLCTKDNHWFRNCHFLNWTMRRADTTPENHKRLDDKCEELMRTKPTSVQNTLREFQKTLPPRIEANMAEVEFPNLVPANLADVHSNAQTVSPATDLINTAIRYVYVFVKALLALLLSSGGLILLLSLFSQFKLTGATEARLPMPKMDSSIAPIRVDMHVDPNNRIRMDAYPAALQIGKSKGNAWDSCAGHNLLPFTNCFHSWDSVSRQYHVQGVSGSAASTGSGYTSIGFELDDSTFEWYDVHGLVVPGIREPLLSAVWFAKNLGIYTVIEDECFIRLPSGATIPCVTDTNTLRCKRIHFGNNTRMRNASTNALAKPNSVVPRRVIASAANVVYASRGKQGQDAIELNFKHWTRAMCGLSPRSLQHLQANTIGSNCPDTVPHSLKDLKWNPSAVAGKERASSHPAINGKRAEKFRDAASMDWLEFTVECRGEKKKFHAHAFVDYATTHAMLKCTPLRTARTALSNTLWYLNNTDRYSQHNTTFVLRSDRAAEYMAKLFKDAALYSGIVQFFTAPYVHQQNGIVERFNQTLQRMVIVILHDSNLPSKYVIYAIEFSSAVYNMVPVESLGWKTRHEMMTRTRPDVSQVFRFGCLLKMLKPLETRTHKFDVHAEDYVNFGPCPLGKGTRALCIRTNRVHVREDVVCYPDVMPFRSMGGSGVNTKLATEIAHTITWDPDGDDVATNAQHAIPNHIPAQQVTTPATVEHTDTDNARGGLSPAPSMHLTTAANSPASGGSFASGSYSPYKPYQTSSPVPAATRIPTVATPRAALNEAHGTLSTKTTRGEWNSGHCSRAECNLGHNHPGPCSDITAPTVQGNPAKATRGARMRAIAEENETTEEICEEAEEEVSDTDERTIDALLATSYSITSPQMLEDDTSPTTETRYGTCIDALSATVDLDELHSPIVNGNQPKPKADKFDMTLPVPTDLKSAMESPNWSVKADKPP